MKIERIIEIAIEESMSFDNLKYQIKTNKQLVTLKLLDKWIESKDALLKRPQYIVELFEEKLLDIDSEGLDIKTINKIKKYADKIK